MALHRSIFSKRGVSILVSLALLLACPLEPRHGSAQVRERRQTGVAEKVAMAEDVDLRARDAVEHAVTLICAARAQDSHGTIPIDQMAGQPALPLTAKLVVDGKKRAERLLPSAKRLLPSVLGRLAADYNLEALSSNWIQDRIKAVTTIKAEVEAHDNAHWRPSDPSAITIGTVFLAGLRSDEAMITVLAHELTHAVNGADQALQPLFARVESRASRVSSAPIHRNMAAELTCEAVGLQVMQAHAGRASGKGGIRRLARAVGKNCVQRDLADENHLSPRATMLTLLALEPELIKAITVTQPKKRPKKSRK